MSNSIFRQSGGTFLGLVIGVLLGLAVALGVAVYVTKVPVPFIDRGVLGDPTQDKAEVQRNKDWNPNATFNQNGAPPAAADPTATPAPAPSVGAGLTTAASNASAESNGSSDPLGDLMAQQSGDSGAPAPTVSTPAPLATAGQVSELVFFVQAGAYGRVQDAEAQRARLAILGIDARVSTDQSNGQTVHRVRSGPFKTRSAALETRQRLVAQKVESLVIAVPK